MIHLPLQPYLPGIRRGLPLRERDISELKNEPVCGIYRVTCSQTSKIYVGSSIDILKRWQQHKYSCVRNKRGCTMFYNALRKYGVKSFTLDIIEECPSADLPEREAHWIAELQATNRSRGYNLTALKSCQKDQTLSPEVCEFMRRFADEDTCHEYAVSLRWPDGVVCPHCDDLRCYFISTRRIWVCKTCRRQFSLKSGTLLEDSPLPLTKWFLATYLYSVENDLSSSRLARILVVKQETAWNMLNKLKSTQGGLLYA